MVGNTGSIVPEAEREYLRAEYIVVHRESRICMGIATPSHAQAIQPVPPTPIDVKKGELGGTPWDPQWDEMIEKALPPEMFSSQVPRGVRRFCPRFYEMAETDKRAFWAYFFQALAGAEAGLNPNTSVRHTEPEVAKRDKVEERICA